MRREPVFGQDLLLCADVWGHIFELDPQQEGEFGHRKDAVAALGKHDDLVPVLLAGAGGASVATRPVLPRLSTCSHRRR